ncbi:MAG TPA: hypothetical protein DCW31_10955 [Lactobacillus sp.]|nr:hypothetical protein [Lactobacillus sp.]
MLILLFPVAMGAGLAMQTAVNSKLRSFVLSSFLSSGFSFLVAWLFLLILSLETHQPLLVSPDLFTHAPAWLWLGGLFGAVALTGNVILFQKIGSLQTTVLPIMGQILMSVLIDQFGLFQSPVSRLSFAKVLGLIIIIAGVLLTMGIFELQRAVLKQEERELKTRRGLIFYQLFAVVAGMLMAMQTAINGHLGHVLESPIRAAFISFTIGVLCLLLINEFAYTRFRDITLAISQGIHYWWVWIGGILGALYILCSSWLVPIIGTGQVVVLALFGQLLFSALIEHYGLFESSANQMTRTKLIGLCEMFVGVLMVKFLTF